MTSKTNGGSSAEGVFKETGWLFRFIQEGWLRKRWRKRFCLLTDKHVYFYEFETNDLTERHAGCLNLTEYHKCSKANKKDSKKSPYTLILEAARKDSKNKSKVRRELLYATTKEDFENWYKQLSEAIAIATMGEGKNLDHVTKSRAKPPGAHRRPPTRQHLRDRATICEVSLDYQEEKKKEPVKRGHVPTSAIKPPPSKAPPAIMTSSPEESNPTPPPPPSQALKPNQQIITSSPNSATSSASSSRAPSRSGSVASETSNTSHKRETGSSFKSTSSENNTRVNLLKSKLTVTSHNDGDVTIDNQMKAYSLNVLDDLGNDLPAPPVEMVKSSSSFSVNKREKSNSIKKRPASGLFL